MIKASEPKLHPFEKGYRRGFAEGRKSVPDVVQVDALHQVQQTHVKPRMTAIADVLHEHVNTAASISQRPLNIHSDLQTPLMVAAAGGALVTVACIVVVGVGAYLLVADVTAKGYAIIMWGSVVAGIATTLANWFGTAKIRQLATISLENVFNTDIDGDGVVGNPIDLVDAPIGRRSVNIRAGFNTYIDMPLSRSQVIDVFAELRKNEWHFSRRKMQGIISQKHANELSGYMKSHKFYADTVVGKLNQDGCDFWSSIANYASDND